MEKEDIFIDHQNMYFSESITFISLKPGNNCVTYNYLLLEEPQNQCSNYMNSYFRNVSTNAISIVLLKSDTRNTDINITCKGNNGVVSKITRLLNINSTGK